MHRMRRWLGLKNLVADAVIAVSDLVRDGNRGTVSGVAAVVRVVPSLRRVADQVEVLAHAGLGVSAALVRGITRAVSGTVDVAHRLTAGPVERPFGDDHAPTPIRSDALGSLPWVRDAALGAVNGIAGDYLARVGNGLGLEMTLRSGGVRLELSREAIGEALPQATGRICLLVHGLATTEWSWSYEAAQRQGDPALTYGTLLQRDAGFTPIYLRYNSGRHVSQNGRELAGLLRALMAAWPVPVESVVLIGHSMGGLVARSACHYGQEAGSDWVDRLTHVFCLGSPHRGSALEKAGNVLSVALAALPVPSVQIVRRILDERSDGIKDLRFGYVRDDEWQGRDLDALLVDHSRGTPLLPHVEYTFVAGAVTESTDHWLAQAIGDLLVRIPSALGDSRVPARRVGGVTHVGLANDPRVYGHILDRLVPGASPAASDRPGER